MAFHLTVPDLCLTVDLNENSSIPLKTLSMQGLKYRASIVDISSF